MKGEALAWASNNHGPTDVFKIDGQTWKLSKKLVIWAKDTNNLFGIHALANGVI